MFDHELSILQQDQAGTAFEHDYKEAIFYLWYNKGKPGAKRLMSFIDPIEVTGNPVPKLKTLMVWINDFKKRAVDLDEIVNKTMIEKSTGQKVAMLERHAKIGHEMQDIAFGFLSKPENQEKLNVNSAVKMLVEGIRIERESLGLPNIIAKISDASDEKLMEEINSILGSSGIDSIEGLIETDD